MSLGLHHIIKAINLKYILSISILVIICGCTKDQIEHPKINIQYAETQIIANQALVKQFEAQLGNDHMGYLQKQISIRQGVIDDLTDIKNGYKTDGQGLMAYLDSLKTTNHTYSLSKRVEEIEDLYNNLINATPIH